MAKLIPTKAWAIVDQDGNLYNCASWWDKADAEEKLNPTMKGLGYTVQRVVIMAMPAKAEEVA